MAVNQGQVQWLIQQAVNLAVPALHGEPVDHAREEARAAVARAVEEGHLGREELILVGQATNQPPQADQQQAAVALKAVSLELLGLISAGALALKDAGLLASTQKALGGHLLLMGRLEEAIPFLQAALPYYQQHHTPEQLAGIQSMLSYALLHTGRHEEAMPVLGATQAYYEQHRTPEELAAIQSAEGDVLVDTGRYAEAEPLLRRALTYYEQAGPPERLAGVQSSLGSLLWHTGRYAEAVPLLRRALGSCRQQGPSEHLAAVQNRLGALFVHTEWYEEAEALLRTALAYRRQYGPPESLAQVQLNLGALLVQIGRYEEAEALLRTALAYRRQYGPAQALAGVRGTLGALLLRTEQYEEAEPLLRATLAYDQQHRPAEALAGSQLNLGSLLQARGQYAEAEGLLRAALTSVQQHGSLETLCLVQNNLGTLLLKTGQHEQAEACFRHVRATESHEGASEGVRDIAWVASTNLASLLQQHGRLEEACTIAREASDSAQTRRASFTTPHTRLAYGATLAYSPHRLATLLYAQTGQGAQALHFSQRAKGQGIIEALRARGALATHQTAQLQVEVSLEALQQALPPRAALVDYTVEEEADSHTSRSWAVVLRKEGPPTCHALELGKAAPTFHTIFDAYIDAYRRGPDGKTLAALREAMTSERLTTLGEGLVGPLAEALEGVETLFLVPTGWLNVVPWPALRLEDHYLYERYLLGTLPTAALLPWVMGPRQATGVPGGYLAYAYAPHGTLTVEQGATTVARCYQAAGKPGEAVVGLQATPSSFLHRTEYRDVLQFWSHGRVSIDAQHHGLALAPEVPGAQVGLLSLAVLPKTGVETDLGILSSCEMALPGAGLNGGLQSNELSGFAWGVLTALRARCVVGSPWLVSDMLNTLLMEEMHQGLLEGQGVALALRRAVDRIRRLSYAEGQERLGHLLVSSVTVTAAAPLPSASDSFDSPAFWSGFLCIGNPLLAL